MPSASQGRTAIGETREFWQVGPIPCLLDQLLIRDVVSAHIAAHHSVTLQRKGPGRSPACCHHRAGRLAGSIFQVPGPRSFVDIRPGGDLI